MSAAVRLGYEPIGASHWSLTAPKIENLPALDARLDCDVGVIGGGYTGLVSALELAASGRRVIVLEAEQPGWAASGRNTGQVIPMMWGAHKGAGDIVHKLGVERGDRMNRMVAAAGRTLFELIDRHQIECEAHQGYVCVMRTEKSWLRWRRSFEAWGKFGGRYELLDRSALSRYVTSPRYAGGVFLPEGGRLNPLSLARGLAAALIKAGGRIYGGSRVTSVAPDGERWQIRTAQGAVRCGTVLVGTGAYTDDLFPVLRQVGLSVCCGVVATDPLPDRGASILPAALPIADMDDAAVFSPTLDARGCLIVSYLIGPGNPTLSSAEKVVGPRLRRAFPQTSLAPFKRLWAGRFRVSADGMPALLRLDRNVYASLLCNGLGHTLGVSAALQMAKLAMGATEEELVLAVQTPRPTPGASFMPGVLRRVMFPLANRFGA